MMETGCFYNQKMISGMTTEELVDLINDLPEWDPQLLEELCKRASMKEEWDTADGDNYLDVAYAAAEKLGVEI